MVHFLAQMSPIAWIGTFFLGWFLLWLPIAIPLLIHLQWQPFHPFSPSQKLPLVASLYAIVPLWLWGIATIKQESFAQYGLGNWGSLGVAIACGMGLGGLGLVLLFGLWQWRGFCQWDGEKTHVWRSTLGSSLLIGLWVSVTEEVVFRGFVLNQLVAVVSPWLAAIAVSLLFAVLHLVWEQQETLPQLPGLWLMGMVLVLARWADQGSLGLAIGLHAGWVSGMISLDTAQVIQYGDRAPEWLVGKYQRPLAGVGGLGLMLLTGGVVWAIAGII